MERERVFRRIIVGLCVILVGCLIALVAFHHKEEVNRSLYVAKLQEQARPYEQELKAIQNEIKQLESGIEVTNDVGMVSVGFQISSVDDFRMIAEAEKTYGFQPIIVIDVSLDGIDDILALIRENKYETVLTVSPYNTETRVLTQNLRNTLLDLDYNVVDTGCFLLRNADESERNINYIAQDGFDGCIRHADAAAEGILDNGLVCMNYSQIKSGNFSISGRLNELEKERQSLLFVFDLGSNSMKESVVTRNLEKVKHRVENGELAYATIRDTMRAIQRNAALQSRKQSEYDLYIENIQGRVSELQDIIDEIYSHWNEG